MVRVPEGDILRLHETPKFLGPDWTGLGTPNSPQARRMVFEIPVPARLARFPPLRFRFARNDVSRDYTMSYASLSLSLS